VCSSADPGVQFCRSKGAGLLTIGTRVCKPRAGLQTPGVRVCTQCMGLHTQGSRSADPRHAGLHLACRSADPALESGPCTQDMTIPTSGVCSSIKI